MYLPEGKWVDLWTGERLDGTCWLKGVQMPLARMPVYAKSGAQVRAYPYEVLCTDEMDLAHAVSLAFDDGYRGFAGSVLGTVVAL